MENHDLYLPLTGHRNLTDVKVSTLYFKDTRRRGYYLSVVPVERERHANGLVSESYMLMDGERGFLEAASRLNRNRLAALASEVERQIAERQGDAWVMVEKVLASQNAALAEGA